MSLDHLLPSRHGKISCVCGLSLALACFGPVRAADPRPDWPATWLQAWADPPAELRPLQIIHGPSAQMASLEGMKRVQQSGLGGIVCNVNFNRYMNSEPHWKTLIDTVEACRKLGMVVWLYDEDGYPSAAAGGLVLKRNADWESLALAYDPTGAEPFIVRRSYEHTHASNNFYAARRYPNLLDADAMRCFIDLTHEAYYARLEAYFGKTIRATFTDEPSLMTVNLGQLGEQVRKKVRVVDPMDERVKPLPSVPWASDLPDQYRECYNEDLMAARKSLFEGDSDADRRVRRQYWAMIADLLADRFYGPIQDWCGKHGIASSGHILHEEQLVAHPALEGNSLKMLGRMDIPGLDMLSSDPTTVLHGGWLTASLPSSAAWLHGRRKVMTEVSDFAQTLGGGKPVPLAGRQATAAWQAALGVTEFTLYYGTLGAIVADHAPEQDQADYRAYCEYVGRLNALLREAEPTVRVALYYPISDLWAEYKPVAQPIKIEAQSPRMQKIVGSFGELGRRMLTSQIGFVLADHELLAGAEVRNGSMVIGGQKIQALVLPEDVALPSAAAAVVEAFAKTGGLVMEGGASPRPFQMTRLQELYRDGRLDPPSTQIVVGRFEREGRRILLVANAGHEAYQGAVRLGESVGGWLADADRGRVDVAAEVSGGQYRIALPAHSSRFLIVGGRR
ncbi:MAG: hypothetical protein KA354_17825 [Phycisphaerae bacterium]|nr:hypothetical protein [Phycisphaerae bacterium]